MKTKNQVRSQWRSARGRVSAKSSQASVHGEDTDPIRETASKLILLLGNSEGTRAGEASFLERWIATYVAELLDAEAKSSGSERAKVRKEIAAVVPALWEQQLQRASLAVRREVDWREARVDTADTPTINLLRKILANPCHAPALASHSKVDVIHWLITVERLLNDYVFARVVSDR
jgi:hypothetical protein